MNEEDIFKKLFQKVDLDYPLENLEETILQKINIQHAYKKQKRIYALVGKIGFICFISLCFVYTLILGKSEPINFDYTFYLLIGIPFILIALMVQLEIIVNRRIPKQASL